MSAPGAHLLHTAVAGCLLNDPYREASALGLLFAGVRVTAQGGFDEAWASTGIEYRVELDAALDPHASCTDRGGWSIG